MKLFSILSSLYYNFTFSRCIHKSKYKVKYLLIEDFSQGKEIKPKNYDIKGRVCDKKIIMNNFKDLQKLTKSKK